MKRLKLNEVSLIMENIFASSNFTMHYEDKKGFDWYLRESIIIASENKKLNTLDEAEKVLLYVKENLATILEEYGKNLAKNVQLFQKTIQLALNR